MTEFIPAQRILAQAVPKHATPMPAEPAPTITLRPAELRRGKWTPEEEEYAQRLIKEFKKGLLPLADGTTLRSFLSQLLNCDPMRISKKFVGPSCIGKVILSQYLSFFVEPPRQIT
jgi:hypothetical protein